ncbi:MAG: hypothetical protein WCA44_15365 [Acidobacteriaceae bacterium]
MAIVVVGGNTRNIGKTSVVAALIARLPEFRWTAFKITQYGHGFCTAKGHPCACEPEEACVAVNPERDASSGTDTSRFLAAGAERVFWIRTRIGRIAGAMPRIRYEIESAPNAILESNSVLEFLQPDLYLTVLDPSVADFKESARRYLPRADAILLSQRDADPQALLHPALLARPRFAVGPPDWVSDSLAAFVRARLAAVSSARGSSLTPPVSSGSPPASGSASS